MAAKKFSVLLLVLGLSSILLWLTATVLAAPNSTTRPTNKATSSQVASLTTTSLNASKDNTLYETPDGSTSNGAGEYFFAGRTNQIADSIRRGVIQFDVANHVLAGSIIVSATLQLTVSKTPFGAGAVAVALHHVTADWGEGTSDASLQPGQGAPAMPGDATWLHRFYSTTFWTTAGGDFVTTASATTTVGGVGFYTWSAPGMVTDIQGWLDAPATNHGWILIGDESSSATAKRFNTRENLAPETRPILIVTYIPPHAIYLPLISRQ